ncbi:MAG TPA: hypothetical protein VM529_03455 [Gemmata sp.]|nr:hypothetical protein [Gemmata sp.]
MAFLLRPPDLREQLTETLSDLGRFRKRVEVATGFFRFVAVLVGGAALACVLDSLFHLPPLARAFALVGTLALAGMVWLGGVARAAALRTDALAVALELEEKYPKLNDSLASAVEFLEAGDAESRGLSNRLQDAAVRHARRMADRHDIDTLARVGRCWRAGWVCGLVVAVAVPLVLVNPARATRALTRLADPFTPRAWPTDTRVEIQVPEQLPARLPRGEPFDLRFVVRGTIPDRALVSFRVAGGEEFHEEYPLTAGNEPKYGSGAAVVAARVEPFRVVSSFEFRIVANDYDSDWLAVEVVPPPRLVPVGGRQSPLFRVVPPAYTGRPAADLELPDQEQWLEVPVGSGVRMLAATDVPLAVASLAFTGDRSAVPAAAPLAHLGCANPLAAFAAPQLAETLGADIPVAVDETGRGLSADLSRAVTGVYALRMTDETGLTATRPVRVRVRPDPAPTVLLPRPTPGRDPTVLTPAGSIPVHVTADDPEYGVRATFLEYRVGRNGALRTLRLEDVRDVARAMPAAVGAAAPEPRPQSARPEPRVLALAAFTRDDGSPLRGGDVLVLRGAADDWDDVTAAKQPGRSAEVEIVVAEPDAVELWLQQNLSELRKDLARVREQQQEAREKVGEVAVQPDGSLAPADRDRLLAAEQAQRQLAGRISDRAEGLRAKVDLLRGTVRANKLPRSTTTARVEAAADQLGRLADRDLPVIEPSLTQARELGVEPARPGDEGRVAGLIRAAGRHQKAVDEGLTDLIDLLAVWGAAGDIRTDARLLRDFILRQAADVEALDREPARADLERAATRAEQARDQGTQLMGRATQLAGEKAGLAAKATAAAARNAEDAAALRAKAAALPPGTPDKSALNAKAALLEGERDGLLAETAFAQAEADALRKGVLAAGGQGVAEDLQAASRAVRDGKRSDTIERLRAAAARLDRLIEALAEKDADAAPDLTRVKKAADDLDDIAGAQDDLRRRTAEAAKIADPEKRAAALKALAAEQDKLIERGKEVFQRLTRERAERPARETRAALDQMELARDELEKGNTGMRAQNEAVERLDSARDRIDSAAAAAPQQLADEQRRRMADKVRGLLERQKGRVAEADRLHGAVAAAKAWERDTLVSYGDLAEAETKIAEEVRVLQKEFAPLPVLARLLEESARAMESAAKRADARVAEVDPALAFDAELEVANDRRVKRPMDLAARRLEQLLDALKPDDPRAKSQKQPATPKGQAKSDPAAPPKSGPRGDLIPPAAQLKVLRALQAELNQRTAEFDKLHPDAAKLTDEERDELKELEAAQRDIAALFGEMAKLFGEQQQPDGPPDAPPAEPETPPPPREVPARPPTPEKP